MHVRRMPVLLTYGINTTPKFAFIPNAIVAVPILVKLFYISPHYRIIYQAKAWVDHENKCLRRWRLPRQPSAHIFILVRSIYESYF